MRLVTKSLLLSALVAERAIAADDFAALCADRAAIERVYYQHRLGTKPPFEQTVSTAELENLVRQELRQEAVLRKNYGVEITPALLAAEVQRINTATQAPETLAEIKAALGNDAARFARSVAQPIVVARFLRTHFDNDDALHAPQRRKVEQLRAELLTAQANGANYAQLLALMQRSGPHAVTETTWQLATRPADPHAPPPDEIEIKKRFGANAQLLSSPGAGVSEQKNYLGDLPEPLQNVLRAQMRQPGNVSAVIEMAEGFRLYLAREKTDAVLSVATLSIPKRSYESWLAEQN